MIRQHQAEGIATARQQGVEFGRRPMRRPPEYEKLREQWQNGEISARCAAERLGITNRIFLIWAKDEI